MKPQRASYVIFLPWAPIYGGGVNHVVHGLSEASHLYYDPVIVVTTSTRPDGYDGPWLYLPYLNPSRPLGFLLRLIPNLIRLRKLLRNAVAANPHFVGLECIPLVFLRRLRLGPPVILSVHGSDITDLLATSGWERWFYQWMFTSADLVVGCSGDLIHKLLPLAPRAKIASIWNATDSAPEVSVKRPLERPYLLCVAGFVKKKAHENLIAAFERIAPRYPDLELVLIGSNGPTRPELEARIESSGFASRIHLLLSRPNAEIWWWMSHAACFVLPSREEPFGIVLLEAGKSRTPVVATRVGGVPEVMVHNEHGLLCDPDRPDQLADAILATFADKDKTDTRVEAFYHKSCSFTWPRAFQRYRTLAELP
jgi:glycosyltransferase involved in cell wall biosynthesis